MRRRSSLNWTAGSMLSRQSVIRIKRETIGLKARVLRFWDNEVLTDIDCVLEVIREKGS
jgi:very-short-patch-repair endonuclease